MKVNRLIFSIILVFILSLTACNLPRQNVNDSVALTLTSAAGTAQALLLSPSATYTVTTTPPPIATATFPIPPTSVVVLPSSTPSGTFFVVDTGANCRFGPSTIYDKITSFEAGTYLTLVGHNSDNSWWYVLVGNLNCWISTTTGHTTGSLTNLPLITAPPTPTSPPGNGPTLSDPVALVAALSYPSNCTNNIFKAAIRVTDNGKGIDSVWLNYRYLGDSGYTGNWHTVSPNDNAPGGVNGFNYAIGVEAAGELGTQNGTFQYQFFAKDNSGNTSSYPSNSILGIPIKYCP